MFFNSRVVSPVSPLLQQLSILRFSLLLVVVACGLRSPLRAAPNASNQPALEVQVGYEGFVKLGRSTPVFLRLNSAGSPLKGRFQITVPDGDGLPTIYQDDSLAFDLKANDSVSLQTIIRIGRPGKPLVIRMTGDDAAAIPAKEISVEAVSTERHLIVGLGEDVGLESAVNFLPGDDSQNTVTARIDSTELMPKSWMGYEGIDTLFISGGSDSLINAATPTQVEALHQWVRMGGRLVLSVGNSAERLLAAGQPLADFSPGEFQRVARQRDVSGLENFADAAERLGGNSALVQTSIRVPIWDNVHGEILAYAGAVDDLRPLVVRSAYGFGQVVSLAGDLNEPPLAQWSQRPRLVARLMNASLNEHAPDDETGRNNSIAESGYRDLAGQMRSALEQFPGVQLVPFSWVAVLIALFVLIAGPGDYLLLRRLRGNMHWTWITFPLLVLVFAIFAVALSIRSRGDAVRTNQVTIVDWDASSGQLRGTSWTRIYSPTSQRFDLSLTESDRPVTAMVGSDRRLTWQGLPGDALGGMDNESALSATSAKYQLVTQNLGNDLQQTDIRGLPVTFGGTKGLLAQWTNQPDREVQSDLTYSSQKLLKGQFTNPLDIPLTDCQLYHDRWVYNVGTLQPGQPVVMSGLELPVDVRWRLTQRRVVDAREATAPWRTDEIDDIPRIAQIMMFHEAADGRGYTGLFQRYQREIDLSHLIQLGRAILVGRATHPPIEITTEEGEPALPIDQQWTYYRIVLPALPDTE